VTLDTIPEVVYRSETSLNGGVPSEIIYGVAPAYDNTTEMHDVVTPCFKEKQAKGEIINSPMTKRTIVLSDEPGAVVNMTVRTSPPYSSVQTITGICPRVSKSFGEQFPLFIADPGIEETKTDLASSQAYANAYDLSKASALVDLKEMRETIQMLRHPLKSAYQLARESLYVIRHETGRTRSIRGDRILREAVGALPGTYLEVRFGWGPLMGSIHDYIDAYQAIKQRTGRTRHTGRGFEVCSESSISNVEISKTCGTTPFLRQVDSRKITETTAIRTGVLVGVTWDSPIAQSLGLTVWDVIPAAWDLIPLSFVADRFVNIGDWLNFQARQFNPNVEYLSSWRTRTTLRRTEDTRTFVAKTCVSGSTTAHYGAGVGRSVKDVHQIQRIPGLPRPSLPVIDVPEIPSLIHTLDYLALGYQSLGRKLSQLRRR
jgi:hypothetical protein